MTEETLVHEHVLPSQDRAVLPGHASSIFCHQYEAGPVRAVAELTSVLQHPVDGKLKMVVGSFFLAKHAI